MTKQEVNGLYSAPRELRFDPAAIRAILVQAASIEQIHPDHVSILSGEEAPEVCGYDEIWI